MKDYLALTKPRITWLILMSTGIGYWFGLAKGVHWPTLLHLILGTGLMASGTAALNQWYEREADARMRRTQMRPLPSGRLDPRHALWFGMGISALGFADLWFGANPLTAILGGITLLTYLFWYTPLKQRSRHSTTVGAIPGAMPPLIGYAAAHGSLTVESWLLFGILFLWQFPHFYSIAWMYREDYERAGIRMLPVVEPDGESTARQMFWYAAALLVLSLIPRYTGMTGDLYLWGALLLGLGYLYSALRVVKQRTRLEARRVLLASVLYLPLLYGLMVIDRVA
jgi:protoheme IX farnesyltransferase